MTNGQLHTIAHNQYANRPADERMESVADLLAKSREDKALSRERSYNLKDLHAVVDNGEVKLQSPRGLASFTHWSFGQASTMVKAPAGYLRTLPPELGAACLENGLKTSAIGQSANVLVRAANGNPEPTVRACTSETYGRVWDADLYDGVERLIPGFQTPPTWDGKPAGAYRGDRDSFLIAVNGGSIVTDPSAGDDGRMYRGIIVRNSEVGASSVYLDTILFRYICGNHMLWGAAFDTQFRRVHRGANVLRDVLREVSRIAMRFTEQSAARDEQVVRFMIDHELAQTKEGIVDELRKAGATKEQAELAYGTTEKTEKASPRSYWGITQGLTRVSQESGYQDERFNLDQIAARIVQLAVSKQRAIA